MQAGHGIGRPGKGDSSDPGAILDSISTFPDCSSRRFQLAQNRDRANDLKESPRESLRSSARRGRLQNFFLSFFFLLREMKMTGTYATRYSSLLIKICVITAFGSTRFATSRIVIRDEI